MAVIRDSTFEASALMVKETVNDECHRFASESEWDASVSPSQMELLSSTGLIEPEEMDEDEPIVHSSVSAWPLVLKSASA